MERDDITPSELTEILDQLLFDGEYDQAVEASIRGNAKMAGFILGACFIDAMAGFYAGMTKEEMKGNSKKRFEAFVGKYLTKYDPETLYSDLRCGLVHSFAEGGTYVFTDANKVGKHFDTTPGGRTLLNLEDFLKDLKDAYYRFRSDIKKDDEIFQDAKRRWTSIGLMGKRNISDV